MSKFYGDSGEADAIARWLEKQSEASKDGGVDKKDEEPAHESDDEES